MARISFPTPLQAIVAALFLAGASLCAGSAPVLAQTVAPAPGSDGATPAVPPPTPVPPAPIGPPSGAPDAQAPASPGDAATEAVTRLNYPLRPTAALSGNGDWDDGFQTITGAFAKIRAAMTAAGLEASGRPIAIFLETDDQGFRFDAMIPLAGPPPGGAQLGDGVRIATTPTGPALKFQHRGAYDDIDSTYEAITAYLDEKGFNAANMFIEEYLNDVQAPDDDSLAVDIYVFLK
jgi:effector-binding domain-containing protein